MQYRREEVSLEFTINKLDCIKKIKIKRPCIDRRWRFVRSSGGAQSGPNPILNGKLGRPKLLPDFSLGH